MWCRWRCCCHLCRPTCVMFPCWSYVLISPLLSISDHAESSPCSSGDLRRQHGKGMGWLDGAWREGGAGKTAGMVAGRRPGGRHGRTGALPEAASTLAHLKSSMCCTCSCLRSSSTSSSDACAGLPERKMRPGATSGGGREAAEEAVAVGQRRLEGQPCRHGLLLTGSFVPRCKVAALRLAHPWPEAGSALVFHATAPPPPGLSLGEASARSRAFRMCERADRCTAEGEWWNDGPAPAFLPAGIGAVLPLPLTVLPPRAAAAACRGREFGCCAALPLGNPPASKRACLQGRGKGGPRIRKSEGGASPPTLPLSRTRSQYAARHTCE